MAWHYGTFSCGHEGRVNIIGPCKDRQYKADRRFSKVCEECFIKNLQEQKQFDTQQAKIKAEEMDLPQLQGTEKQVAWAITLRQKFIDAFDKLKLDELEYRWKTYEEILIEIRKEFGKEYAKELTTLDAAKAIKDYVIENYTSSRFYIDNKDHIFMWYIVQYHKEAFKTDEQIAEEQIEEMIIKDIKAESTICPKNSITSLPVEIIFNDNEVSVIFEKNDRFNNIVKSLHYRWDGVWIKKINKTTGTATDRAAELGNKLLNEGFPICIFDEKVLEKAIKGEYEPECTRWIFKRKDSDVLAITWEEKNDKLYNAARKLPKSKWDNPSVIVKIAYCKEIQEFAQLYEFKFTEASLKAIADHKAHIEKIKIVNPIKTIENIPKDGLQEILNSGSEVLDDLKD